MQNVSVTRPDKFNFLPGWGEPGRGPAASLDQRAPAFPFQRLDVVRERRLGYVQALRRGGEVEVVREFGKLPHMLDVHQVPFPKTPYGREYTQGGAFSITFSYRSIALAVRATAPGIAGTQNGR